MFTPMCSFMFTFVVLVCFVIIYMFLFTFMFAYLFKKLALQCIHTYIRVHHLFSILHDYKHAYAVCMHLNSMTHQPGNI